MVPDASVRDGPLSLRLLTMSAAFNDERRVPVVLSPRFLLSPDQTRAFGHTPGEQP